jgi:hypothetical protein
MIITIGLVILIAAVAAGVTGVLGDSIPPRRRVADVGLVATMRRPSASCLPCARIHRR